MLAAEPDTSSTAARMVATRKASTDASFAAWADGIDLFSVCYLNPVPWRAEP